MSATLLKRARRNHLWLSKHLDQIVKQYRGKWIAIHNQQIIASATTIEELYSKLEQQQIPLKEVLIEYIPKHEVALIL